MSLFVTRRGDDGAKEISSPQLLHRADSTKTLSSPSVAKKVVSSGRRPHLQGSFFIINEKVKN